MVVGGISAIVFLLAGTTAWLFVGRVLSGFAVGIASGTGTAWIAELEGEERRPQAALLATGANFLGLVIGPILAGALAEYVRWPLQLPYVAYLILVVTVGVLVARAPETVDAPARGLGEASLKPRLGVPPGLRAAFVAPAVTIFATMAFVGFYAALAPTLMKESLHEANLAVEGAVVSELFVVATATIVATRALGSRSAMLSGLALFLPSLALLVAAQALGSLAVLLIGTALGGIASALGYRGSLQVINQIAPSDRRAEMVSSFMVAGFVGNALPIIGVGFISAKLGLMTASVVFAAVIAALAIAALVIGVVYTPKK
jgi:MFS family permease